MKELRTQRLTLRPISIGDAQALHPLMTWNVVRWLSGPPWPLSLEDVAAHLAKSDAEMRAGQSLAYAVVIDGRACGAVDIRSMRGAMDLGYWLAEANWGRGLMTEAVRLVIDAFFRTNPAIYITSGAFAGNLGSLRVQENVGFKVVAEDYLWSHPNKARLRHLETMLGREAWERRLAA